MAETFRAARSPYEKHTTRCANGEDEIRIRADDESDISTMGSGGELIPNAAQQEDDSEDRIKSNPSLVLLFDVPASSLDCNFNPLAACGRDALVVEDDQRHLDIVPSAVATRAVSTWTMMTAGRKFGPR